MNHSSSWMREFLGVLGAHLLLFTHIFRMFGQAWGPNADLGLKHSLDGLLHQTRAIWGSLLLPAPSSHSTPHPLLHCLGELLLLRLPPNLSLKKNILLRIFLDKVGKKLPSFWCSKHRVWETLPASQYWIFKGGSCGGRDLCGEFFLKIGSWVELTTTAECITQDSSWAIDR